MRSTYLFLLCALVAPPAVADVVHLEGGGTVEGRVEERGDTVVVHMPSGTLTLERSRVVRIEKKETVLDVYEAKKTALPDGDAQARYELGLWCQLAGLGSRARAHFEDAVRLDPDHAGSRRELGHVRHDGRWMTEDEARVAQGLVQYQGRWLEPETVARLLRADKALAEFRAAREGEAAIPPGPAPGPGPAAGGPAGPAPPPPGPTGSVPKLTESITPTWKLRNEYFAGRWPWMGSPQRGRIYWAGPGGVYGPVYYGPYPYGKGGPVDGPAYGYYGVDLLSAGYARSAARAAGGGFALGFRHGDPGDDFFLGGTIFGGSFSGSGVRGESLGTALHGGSNFGNGFLRFRFNP